MFRYVGIQYKTYLWVCVKRTLSIAPGIAFFLIHTNCATNVSIYNETPTNLRYILQGVPCSHVLPAHPYVPSCVKYRLHLHHAQATQAVLPLHSLHTTVPGISSSLQIYVIYGHNHSHCHASISKTFPTATSMNKALN